ncbi:MAG: hypothetical protein AAGK04_13280, partial [Planctomycetota bacterium]
MLVLVVACATPTRAASSQQAPGFGRLIETVEDEPGSRLAWSLDQVGVNGAPIEVRDAFERVDADRWRRPTLRGEGAGAVIVRVRREADAAREAGAIDADWPEPSQIVRVTTVDPPMPTDRRRAREQTGA